MPEQSTHSQGNGAELTSDPELVLTHLDSLPTLPTIAIRLVQITSDPESSVSDVIRLLQGDQSLTAKTLSVASSAWTGVREPVTTLDKAVPLLGFNAVRTIALAVTVFENLGRSAEGLVGPFDRIEFWKHSLAVACASRRLAEACAKRDVEPNEAFVAGLLHDVGKVALDTVFPKAYQRIAGKASQSRGDIADFERAILGADHTVAGRRLAERWRLPAALREVIWLHHLAAESLPASVSHPTLIGIVQLADTIAREQRIGYSGNHMFYDQSPRLAERLSIPPETLAEVTRSLFADVAEQAELLGLDSEPADALYLSAMTKANSELGRMNTELAVSSQRLAARARYFEAISLFDSQLSAWSDPPEVVTAMANAAVIALQRQHIAAFGLRDRFAALDLCSVDQESGRQRSEARSVPDALRVWLSAPKPELEGGPMPAPPAVRDLLVSMARELGRGEPWLVPVAHDGTVSGGLVFLSEADERARFNGELADLRSFMASLGLALGRANAQAAARRLSDELAETNRRLQQTQVELMRSRTLSMIAEMAAGAGHELNSPLTVISGRAQMLSQMIEDNESRRSLEVIRSKAHECSRIVSELMDFARPRPPVLEVVSLPAMLDELREEWLERGKVPPSKFVVESTRWPPAVGNGHAIVPQLHADRKQLKTAFRELISNAAAAVSTNEGDIRVVCQPAVSSDAIEVLIQDTGIGMQPAVLQRAFDPFFSHRNAGRGRGLGLPKAFRIIEAHGGRIWLESVPDEGTTAHIILPPTARPGLEPGNGANTARLEQRLPGVSDLPTTP